VRAYILHSALRLALVSWLLGPSVAAVAVAENARGTLLVSMTVQASCEVRADHGVSLAATNQTRSDAATVTCPITYPFRASLSYGATAGVIGSGGDAGLVFTGEHRLDLSRLSGPAGPGAAMLTISY